jgi:hypothetical protein
VTVSRRRAWLGAVAALLLAGTLAAGACFLFGGAAQALRWSAGRALTPGELRELRSVFYDALDYSRIRVARAPFPGPVTACVIGSRISFTPGYYRADFSTDYLKMALLVHEAGHVWANQRLGAFATLAELFEHLRYGDAAYTYRLSNPPRPLADYGFEQQGHILRDYYERRYLGEDIARYEATIYRSLKRPGTHLRAAAIKHAPGAGIF